MMAPHTHVLTRDLAAIRRRAVAQLNAAFADLGDKEPDHHAIKRREAAALAAGGKAPTLEWEAGLKRTTVHDLADVVRERACAAEDARSELEMKRQDAKAAIRKANTPRDIETALRTAIEGARLQHDKGRTHA